MTATTIAVPTGREDQAYRIARQVRYDGKGTAVHRVVSATFHRQHGYLYRTRCDVVMPAARGAILTTREVDCPGCVPGWKA